ncbi:NAD-binding protein, partial [Corynebacterium heidelbergense]
MSKCSGAVLEAAWGAGIIAVEFAHVFSAFGTAVTVLARGENL